MTVDWFLVDAPHVVPQEFQAWETAKERHRSVFFRCCDANEGTSERVALQVEGEALKIEVEGRPGIMKNSPKTAYSSELKSES